MCLSIPAKVLRIEGDRATVVSQCWTREVDVRHLEARAGDHVLVQGGVALQVLTSAEAEEMLAAWEEVGGIPDA